MTTDEHASHGKHDHAATKGHEHESVHSEGTQQKVPCGAPSACELMVTCSSPPVYVTRSTARVALEDTAHAFAYNEVRIQSLKAGPEPPPPKA